VSLPYYKRFPRDFLEGTIGLRWEAKAIYSILLDLIYIRDGRLADDPRYIAGVIGCSVKLWNNIKRELVEAGKIRVENGLIMNARADCILEETRAYQEQQAANRRGGNPAKTPQDSAKSDYKIDKKSGKTPKNSPPPNKNKGIEKRSSDHTESESESLVSNETREIRRRVEMGFQIFVGAAGRVTAWPVPKALSEVRRKKLEGRIRENGLDGWEEAVRKAEASRFLRGEAGRTFAFSFDWLVEPRNFQKVTEGNYDDKPTNGGGGSNPGGAGSGHAGGGGGFAAFKRRLAGEPSGDEARGHSPGGGSGPVTLEGEFTSEAGRSAASR
jgi:uncharacterized protein YdaU (DUF1376 family)